MTRIREFVSWYNNEFKLTRLWADMEATTEGSPWHRERSVATHTDMVVMTLLGLQDVSSSNTMPVLMALFAAAFHDVGKPAMRQIKHSTERGEYSSFSEHELRSARLWQDYYMVNRADMQERFGIEMSQFYTIAVMIEKHRPWGMKDTDKIRGIFSSVGPATVCDYLKLLEADNSGRISDSPDALQNSLTQIKKFADAAGDATINAYHSTQRKFNLHKKLGLHERAVPQLIMPISQAGSGKSSLFKQLHSGKSEFNPTNAEFYQHSMDMIREELYGPDVEVAFKASTEDSDFKQVVQADFIAAVKEERSIYVDNTNLSAKRRRFYITEARRHGYDTMAILIPLSIEEAISRNLNRTNKTIPSNAVWNQYMALSMPMLHYEFDQIGFVD